MCQIPEYRAQGDVLVKYTRNRKNNTAQLKIIRFYQFQKNMKPWLSSSILLKKIAVYLHHCLNLCTETSVGLRHADLVEVAHQLLIFCYHQGGDIVVRGFIGM